MATVFHLEDILATVSTRKIVIFNIVKLNYPNLLLGLVERLILGSISDS